MPTILFTNSCGSAIAMAYVPKARRRTMPNSLSRKVTGSMVPHFMSMKSARLTKYDFGPEGRLAAEGDAEQARQQRDVHGGEGVPARPEHVERLAVAEEDRCLAFAHDQLRPQLQTRPSYPAARGAPSAARSGPETQ